MIEVENEGTESNNTISLRPSTNMLAFDFFIFNFLRFYENK
jgi:hypothetical protein